MEKKGMKDVEVYSRIECSLNGRTPQMLVDPEVDLMKVKHSILPADWILPLEQPLREERIAEGEAPSARLR